jgi:replication initiation protein RepC
MTNSNNTLETSTATDRRTLGRRKLDLESIGWRARSQEAFRGLPAGVTSHHALLDTFKAAAPTLGLSRELVELMDKLVSYTSPQDWQAGSRPLVWPSNFSLAEDLDRTPRAIQTQIAGLQRAGLLVMKDSPTGRRYGERDSVTKKLRLPHSYGFDLSLLAIRYADLKEAAQRHVEAKAAKATARRRSFIAKTKLLQMIATADAESLWSGYWEDLEPRLRSLALVLKERLTLDEALHLASSLERMAEDAEALLAKAIKEKQNAEEDSSVHESAFTLKTYTNDPLELKCDSSASASSAVPPSSPTDPLAEKNEASEYRTSPHELAALAPPLGAAAGPDPGWPQLLTAAEGLRERIGIPQRAWNMAFEHLGRIGRLITLADLLTFPDSHFTGGRPAYFQGMVNRAKRGELRLDRALYGMRGRAQSRTVDPGRHTVTVPLEMPGIAARQAGRSVGDVANSLGARLAGRRIAS